jgi:hypothetical protein
VKQNHDQHARLCHEISRRFVCNAEARDAESASSAWLKCTVRAHMESLLNPAANFCGQARELTHARRPELAAPMKSHVRRAF